MKALGLILLLAASWVNTAFGKANLYTGWTQKFNNASYPDLTAQVGDTITFIWTINEVQNVFIHPTNDCTQTGRIAVGNISPTEYTFKPEDGTPGGKPIFFANDVGERCESFGMRLIVTVFPDDDGGEIPIEFPSEPPVVLTSPPVVPTDFPVAPAAPTFPPVAPVAPTEAPVFPTLPPVAPTLPPVVPTDPPVVPTDAPVFPTDAPVFPTDAPVFPTEAPVFPTEAPISPTDPPTGTPTGPPVAFPTLPPTPVPTAEPTKNPTLNPTTRPTGVPTAVPTVEAPNRKRMMGLQMTLVGIDSFSDRTKEGWTKETEAFCTSYYENDVEGSTFVTSIAVTNFVISSNSRRSMRRSGRNLQTGDVIITYNQVVSYEDTGNAFITEEYLAKVPFGTPDQRDNYVDSFQNLNDPVLEAVTDSSPVTFADEISPTSAPINIQPQPNIDPDDKFSLSLAAIIGIGCGGGAVLIIAILFCIYCRAKKSKDSSRRDDSPPTHNVAMKADEVSTLAGPSIPGNSPLYGDRR
jgi:hypothetical protein